MLRSIGSIIGAGAGAAAALAAGILADIKPLDLPPGGRRRAPRRFGDVTIRAHQDGVPKPTYADRSTVSDFTAAYTPGRKGKGRPAASYRAARRNAGREDRRLHLYLAAAGAIRKFA